MRADKNLVGALPQFEQYHLGFRVAEMHPPPVTYAASVSPDLANEYEFSVVMNPANQQQPTISGNIIVWADDRNGNRDIYGKNILTGEEFPICTNPTGQRNPAISGDIVVWTDERNSGDWCDIYGKNLSTGQEFPVCTAPGIQQYVAISGDYVFYLDQQRVGLYVKKLSTGQEYLVDSGSAVASSYDLAIYGNIVVYTKNNIGVTELHGKNIQTGTAFPICTNVNSVPNNPAIYGDIVVWEDHRNGGGSENCIYGKNICSGEEFLVAGGSWWHDWPVIYNNIVVWMDYRNGKNDLYGKDLSTQQEFPVCLSGTAAWPSISKNNCIWLDSRNNKGGSNTDIYGNIILPAVIVEEKRFSFDPVGAMASDPVNTLTGNFYHNETDLSIPGPGMNFEFARAYNASDSYCGPLGPGWTHSYNVFLVQYPSDSLCRVKWGDGQGHYYLPDVGNPNSYHPAISAIYGNLKKNPDNSWTLTQKDLTRYNFGTTGKLTSIVDKNGNTISLTYDGNSRLNQITDTAGRLINIVYNASNLVQSVTDPNNRQIIYSYTNGKLTSVTDAKGNPEYYTYDPGNGKLKTVTDRRGTKSLENIYDSYGRVIQQINGRGKTSSFAYNTPGQNKTTVTDPLGRQTVHTYDEYLRLISITDPNGHSVSYTYDNKGNRTSITDENGNVRYFTYDSMGNTLTMAAPPTDPNDPSHTTAITKTTYDTNTNNPLTKTDANGITLARTWVYQYDSNGNLIRTIDPNGGQSLRTYTTKGLLATETDADGHTTGYTYDTQGNLTDINDAIGNTHCTYDAVGRMLTKRDARVNTTVYSYDKNNNLLTETDPKGKITDYTYDKNNDKTSMTDKRGHTWTYYYNENNILNREVDPDGFETLYGYDNVDNRISVTDKRGKITRYTYNVLNRLIDVNDPLGHHTTYTYDAKGNKLSQTNALGKTWTYKYDVLDRLIEEKDPLGNSTKYEYDLLGRKISITNAKGNKTQYGYDKLDRLMQVTDALGNITHYQYDPVSNLTAIIDANGKVSTRQYDALNRLISEADPLGNATQYEYDEVGNRIAKTDAMGRITNYSYDQLNRLIDISYPDSTMVHYAYDENGNRITMTDWNGSSSFEYDALNRIAAGTDAFGNRVEYEYDPIGNRRVVVYPDAKTVTYDYDDAGRLVEVADWNARITTYTYDAANNLKSVLLPNSSQQLYDYDDAGRLISLQNKDKNASIIGGFEYTLDAVGNRIEIKETGALNPIISYSNANYAYDDADRILTSGSCSYSFNDNGDQTSRNCGNLTQYTYDFKDLLVGACQSGLNIEHTYDGIGNRVEKTVNSTEKRYVLDTASSMSQVLCETDGSGNITAYYIYGVGLLAKITPDGREHHYHYDGLGSTVALTNELGDVTDRYSYLPFGENANSQGVTYNPFKYVGRLGVMTEPDGTLFMRARFYDPTTGRFLSKDPVDGKYTDPLSLHRYSYARNSPNMLVDPSGKIVWVPFLLWVATGVSADLFAFQNIQRQGDERKDVAGALIEGVPRSLGTGLSAMSGPGFAAASLTLDAASLYAETSNNKQVEDFVGAIRTAWSVSRLLGGAAESGTNSAIHSLASGQAQQSATALSVFNSYQPEAEISYRVEEAIRIGIPMLVTGINLTNTQSNTKINTSNKATSRFTSGGGTGGGGGGGGGASSYSTVNSSQAGATPKVNVPVITSANPQTYSQTYTSTTRKYR